MIDDIAGTIERSRTSRVLSGCFRRAHRLAAAAALALALVAPSPGSAQTLSLGNAGDFGLFATSHGSAAANIGGVLNVTGTVGLDGNSFLMMGSGSTIGGALYQSSTAHYWGSTPGGGVQTGSAINAFLSHSRTR